MIERSGVEVVAGVDVPRIERVRAGHTNDKLSVQAQQATPSTESCRTGITPFLRLYLPEPRLPRLPSRHNARQARKKPRQPH